MSNSNLEYLSSMESAIVSLTVKHGDLAARIAPLDAEAVNTLGEEIAYINREHKRLRDLESTPEDGEFSYRREDAGHLAHRIALAATAADCLWQEMGTRKAVLHLCA